jgi:hypothetical protein
MTIERNKQKINKMLNAKKIQDWIDKIKTTEKDPKYYEQALLDIITRQPYQYYHRSHYVGFWHSPCVC